MPHRAASNRATVWRICERLLVGSIGGIVGAVAGWIIGATYGGGFATTIELVGLRGYEATGLVGQLLGAATVAAMAFFLARRSTVGGPR